MKNVEGKDRIGKCDEGGHAEDVQDKEEQRAKHRGTHRTGTLDGQDVEHCNEESDGGDASTFRNDDVFVVAAEDGMPRGGAAGDEGDERCERRLEKNSDGVAQEEVGDKERKDETEVVTMAHS